MELAIIDPKFPKWFTHGSKITSPSSAYQF